MIGLQRIAKFFKKRKKWILTILVSVFVLMVGLTFYLDYKVSEYANPYLYDQVEKIPFNKVAVLLGTSKFNKNGEPNQYFKNRIDAAALLYHSGKCKCIIASGDNSIVGYDEPSEMKLELIKAGVPDSAIYLDYAGFRTFDSMIRAYMVFGQGVFTVISQRFHNERAVYIARYYGIEAIGFNAREVESFNGFKTKLREKVARVKLFLDFLFDKQPKFLGKAIEIK